MLVLNRLTKLSSVPGRRIPSLPVGPVIGTSEPIGPFLRKGDAHRHSRPSRRSPARPTMATIVQRPLKGSRISTFYPVKNLPALFTLDSAFQLQEYISLTIRSNIHDVQAIVSIPDSRSSTEGCSDDSSSALADEPDGDKDARNEFAVDEACWIYEQLRYAAFYALENLSGLAISSLDDLRRTFPIP